MNKRLRIFDLNTPWFWLSIFFQRRYAKPWLEMAIWPPNKWKRFWIYVWQKEAWPDERGAYAMPGNKMGEPGDMPKTGAGLREGE